jgi:Glycosyl hydrolase family 76
MPASTPATFAARAVTAYAAMQRFFYVPDGTSLYALTWPRPRGGHRYAYVWEFSRALAGTLAVAGLPAELGGGPHYASAVDDRFQALDLYWDRGASPPAFDSYVRAEGGGDKYYDDNVWLGLAFVQRYRQGLTSSLDRATQIFAFGRAGWDTHERDPRPGGVFWVDQRTGLGRSNHDRGAGATAGYAELGLHLLLLTGDDSFCGDGSIGARPASPGAANMMNWVNAHLDSSRRGYGPFWNVVRRDGSIDTNLWSYNQGVMIGACVLRYQVSGAIEYLEQARAIARRTLEHYGDFTGQPPSFNAMLFQNLLMLHPHADAQLSHAMLRAMESYAEWTWITPDVRDPDTNLFYFDDAGRPARPSGQPAQLRDQGAMTQLYALLAWPARGYDNLT